MQCTNCGAELQPGATVCPSCEQRVVPTRKSTAAPRARAPRTAAPQAAAPASTSPAATAAPAQVAAQPASDRSPWAIPILVAVVVVVIAVSGFVVNFVLNSGSNTPDGAALRMMQAYAAYDTTGFFANITHSSLTATDMASYEQAAAADKAANKGVALYKDIKVVKVTIDPKDPNSATVQLSEQILDPAKGTYSPRTDTLALVKQNGKWLVKLY